MDILLAEMEPMDQLGLLYKIVKVGYLAILVQQQITSIVIKGRFPLNFV